ncbi:MAG TPA: carbohydrate-binding family 9-like protein, partial [Planctomycetota bacterium]|nr:carbohydrate-binding family 9-like protein [Planctomycetota bacterium]
MAGFHRDFLCVDRRRARGTGWRDGVSTIVGCVIVVLAVGCGEPTNGALTPPPVTGAAPGDPAEQLQVLTRENLDLKMRLVEADAKTMPTLKAVHCAQAPVVDGKPDDAAWATAEEIRFETNPWEQGEARREPATRVKVLYDNDFLYVLFRVEGEQWVATEKARDGKVYEDERVEVFLDTDERDDFYDCVEINAIGTVDDYQCEFYRGYHHEWSPETLTAAASTWTEGGKTIGYVIETKVPWNAVTSKQNVGGKVIKEKEV